MSIQAVIPEEFRVGARIGSAWGTDSPSADTVITIWHVPCGRQEIFRPSRGVGLDRFVMFATNHECPPADAVGGDPRGGWTRVPRLDPREDY